MPALAASARRCVWIGGTPTIEGDRESCRLIVPNRTDDIVLRMRREKADWFVNLLEAATPRRGKHGNRYPTLKDMQASYPRSRAGAFNALFRSTAWRKMREAGLLLV